MSFFEFDHHVVVSAEGYTHSDYCSFTVNSKGEGFVQPEAYGKWFRIDGEHNWGNIGELEKKVFEWYNKGNPPRDQDDRIVPFPKNLRQAD